MPTDPRRLLSTPSGTDRVLALLYYLSTFLSPTLATLARSQTLTLPTPIPLLVITPSAAALATTSSRLKLLASRISDVRMFMRLWGLIGIYEWGLSTYRSPPKDPVERAIVWGQVAVNTVYQVLENAAYLNMHGILGMSKRAESRAWLWSTRCWAAHIFLDFVRLERARKKGLTWKKSWVCNAANAPLSVSLCVCVFLSLF